MARLRYNGLSTTLGASLSSGATSVTFAAALTHSGGTAVPTLAGGNVIPLSILTTTGELSEVVYLTAYTAAATTGTIARGREGTAGVSHASGDPVVAAPTVLDYPSVADQPPTTANAKDDEFDGTSSASWSAMPTAAAISDINTTFKGRLYLKPTTSEPDLAGIRQTAPAAPFTIETKISDTNSFVLSNRIGGIVLLPAAATNASDAVYVGLHYNSSTNQSINVARFAQPVGSGATNASAAYSVGLPIRFKVTCPTSTTFSWWWARPNSELWIPGETGLGVGFTVGQIGLVASAEGGGVLETTFDYFRVT